MVIQPDGSFQYTPDANFHGADSFTFRANDGSADSNTATEAITVVPVNDAPTLTGVPSSLTSPEANLITFVAVGSDFDGPNPSVSYSLSGAPSGASVHPGTGVFSWTPTEAQGPGSYSFSMVVSDGVLSTLQGITVNVLEVNASPVANAQSRSTTQGVSLSIALTGADSDLPAQSLTYLITTPPANGTLSGLNPATGSVTYTPSAGYTGSDSFQFAVRDNGTPTLTSSPAVVSLTITPASANQPPVLTVPALAVARRGTTLTRAAIASDPNLPGDTLRFSIAGGFRTGMSINSITGQFRWVIPANHPLGFFNVSIRVTDAAGASDTERMVVWVVP